MKVRSLGYRTDLIFPRFDGEIIDREGYLVIRTPTNPTYFWGNFLLFQNPPGTGDFKIWKELFATEIGSPPKINHMAFGWDSIYGKTGQAQPFLDDGFELDQSVVLTTAKVQMPPKYNHEVTVRPISQDWEWSQALQNQLACRSPEYNPESYRVYKQGQMAAYRRMTRAGMGNWFGAFLDDRLVADLGQFCDEGICRFQQVVTHPDFRRRGICGALVHQASDHGLKNMNARILVMVADEGSHAAIIYESVGFKPRERQVGYISGIGTSFEQYRLTGNTPGGFNLVPSQKDLDDIHRSRPARLNIGSRSSTTASQNRSQAGPRICTAATRHPHLL